ncbi:hypothetical protein ACLIBG_00475 [Virgibacillus sp. W0181]|uniref:hypothetical protein n=1 Tax=Virgibacillus sp. W0181 TaxID=3391581 RepID=UPI003F4811EC
MILKLIIDLLFLVIFGFFLYQFIQVLFKMNQKVIFPKTNEDISAIRQHPEKPVDFPTYAKQKIGIIIYSLMLLFVMTMFLLGAFFQLFDWSLYLLLFLPIANSHSLLNLFAIVDDGLLSGRRFIPWHKIKSYQFVPIDINHKYYGFSLEANAGYELKVKTKGFPLSFIITTDEMKGKLNRMLSQHVNANDEQPALKESR